MKFTNSADSQTGRQKLRNLRLCPPIGRWPTSPGVHPNYSLSFTTNVDRSFPNHLKIFGSHPSMWWSIRLPGLIFGRSHPKINYFSNFASARFRSKMKLGRSDFPQNYFLLLKFRVKLIRCQTNSGFPDWSSKVEKFPSVSAHRSEAN